jgi:basic membrane protein A and related proteins
LKRVDVATYDSFMAAKNGTWKGGVTVYDLKNNGVGYAEDQWNKPILTPDAKKAADDARADIISGKLQVHDYMSDNKCPV